ncbi:MAG: GNAT family N-acetyltransferase [Cyanobacteria bacterium CRU_2_1]|nr:GNAT family N-acetyltransferase [Cyanobacteria bacterium RU_5_0]NJR59264.1 GNAT family N-acetyltransferase [Cyanobacteria bacterium CRU_2_1]
MYSIEIRLAHTQQELEAMYYQRWLVLRSPLGMEQGTEKDKFDESCSHLIAICGYQITALAAPDTAPYVVGSARLRELSSELGSIAYLAVLPEFQHQGIGTALVKRLTEIARQKTLRCLRVMTRTSALKFYQRLGFIEKGEPHDYLGIPHSFMYLNLPSSPDTEASP